MFLIWFEILVILCPALTYFLSVAKDSDEKGQAFLKAYLEKNPECEHIVAPLALERDKRNQDLVSVLCYLHNLDV